MKWKKNVPEKKKERKKERKKARKALICDNDNDSHSQEGIYYYVVDVRLVLGHFLIILLLVTFTARHCGSRLEFVRVGGRGEVVALLLLVVVVVLLLLVVVVVVLLERGGVRRRLVAGAATVRVLVGGFIHGVGLVELGRVVQYIRMRVRSCCCVVLCGLCIAVAVVVNA